MTPLSEIQDFLSHRRLALIGVSHNPRDISRSLLREFQQRGYDVVPVNPALPEVDGAKCYPSIEAVSPAVEGALLLTNPSVTEKVVEECARAGVRSLWLYRAGGAGAVSPKAVSFCQSNGMAVVAGECPFMFLPKSGWIHQAHGFCRKLIGRYPK